MENPYKHGKRLQMRKGNGQYRTAPPIICEKCGEQLEQAEKSTT